MDYQKELAYLNNMERQFRIIGVALNQAKKEGKKTINLKKLCKIKKPMQSGIK